MAPVAACARFGFESVDGLASSGGAGGEDPAAVLVGGSPSVAGAGGMGTGNAGAGGLGDAGSAAAGQAGSQSAAGGAGGSGGEISSGGAPDDGVDAGPPPTCSDGLLNQDEVLADCGGICVPCPCTFTAPELLGSPNGPGLDVWGPSITGDGMTLFFSLIDGVSSEHIRVATRPTKSDPFGVSSSLPGPVNQTREATPYVTPNGLSLYFNSDRSGATDLYVATRASLAEDFGNVTALTELNTSEVEHLPWVSADELHIYFGSTRGMVAGELYYASRAQKSDPFGVPVKMNDLNTTTQDDGITMTQDRRVAIFTTRAAGPKDLYIAMRASTDEPFATPELMSELSSSALEYDPALTPDGDELFFTSTRGGSPELYRSQRVCP